MSKLIINVFDGTIIDINDCFIIDEADLTEEESALCVSGASDLQLSAIAERCGVSVEKMGKDTGWGDNSYSYTVSYSPKSIMDEADAYIEGGIYSEEDDEYNALKWVLSKATIEQLKEVSSSIMSDDSVWDDFRGNMIHGITWGYSRRNES